MTLSPDSYWSPQRRRPSGRCEYRRDLGRSQKLPLEKCVGDPFDKMPRHSDLVSRDKSQPFEIGVRRIGRRTKRHCQVDGERVVRGAVVGAPRARIVSALRLRPGETHHDSRLPATAGAGGIIPFEPKAMEGIVMPDQAVIVSRRDNRGAMYFKPASRCGDDVAGLMKRC
jgi:hypothetical protein